MTDYTDDFYSEDEEIENINLESLEELCNQITDYWLEDYTFEDLFEEFDLTPGEVLFTMVTAGMIDREALENFLAAN